MGRYRRNTVLWLVLTGLRVCVTEVSLKQGDHFVQLKVNGMQRIQTKTSKCGSVVEFKTVEGVLTVDDYTISADDQLAGYLQQAGQAITDLFLC